MPSRRHNSAMVISPQANAKRYRIPSSARNASITGACLRNLFGRGLELGLLSHLRSPEGNVSGESPFLKPLNQIAQMADAEHLASTNGHRPSGAFAARYKTTRRPFRWRLSGSAITRRSADVSWGQVARSGVQGDRCSPDQCNGLPSTARA
jgi:hypothetical protein